ncbi:vWA domain-containing protein [Frigoriglobus tundricola]|uniref:VWFA domain-containing protein n=1 Tax=Frigoriglobus tundricola TaxID=2774151 RepID=A0A6M5YSC7_9BACT|nr:vWA domain-containing protein [Frigoriglobus tundricola]QJW96324.1 hypothetical protein FTUN_3881 [Frigoriglobus tundricola]
MRPKSRATLVAFRRAVWASVALHAVVACGLVLYLQAPEKHVPAAPGLDTRVRISLTDDAPMSAEVGPPESTPAESAPPPDVPAPPVPSGPLAQAVPQTLPPELVALIRKPTPAPVGAEVVEVPLPTQEPPPRVDPNVRPAGGPTGATAPTAPTTGAPSGPPVRAIHGALAPGQTVVYVLDCSGSMGAAGKFDTARAALVATLKQQPATVRFQIICYAGTAGPLLASDRNALLANEANVRAAIEKLATLEPRGLSDHFGAIRAALVFRPSVVLILSDGDDIRPATVKSVVDRSGQSVPVCLGRVTAEGVQNVRELK